MIKLENYYQERNSTIRYYPTSGSEAGVEPKIEPKVQPLDEKPIFSDEKPPLFVDDAFNANNENYSIFRQNYRSGLPYFPTPANRQYCVPLPQPTTIKQQDQFQHPLSPMTIKQQQDQFQHPLSQAMSTMAIKQQAQSQQQPQTQSQQQQQQQHHSPSISTTVHSVAIDTVPYTTTALPSSNSESKAKNAVVSTSAPDTTKKSGTRRPEKPPVSYINMIAQAIRESPDKRLTLNEIYLKLRSKWVHRSDGGWANIKWW